MAGRRTHRTKRRPAPRALPPTTAKDATADHLHERHEIWAEFRMGLVITTILIVATIFIAQTWIGNVINGAAVAILQHQLSQGLDSSTLPIEVIDISSIRPRSSTSLGPDGATPRQPLQNLIDHLVHNSGGAPASIGVDIDFSPTSEGYSDPDHDPDFFEYCLHAGVPIHLGVYRGVAAGPSGWLGSSLYQPLAAAIAVPKSNNSRAMLREIGASDDQQCPSMAEALARDYMSRHGLSGGDTPIWLRPFLRRFGEPEATSLVGSTFLTNYGPLDTLMDHNQIIHADAQGNIEGTGKRALAGKMVLIGDKDGSSAMDMFPVPFAHTAVPGVFLHACAAYTLAENPLYEMTRPGHVLLDIAVSGIVLLVIALVRLHIPAAIDKADPEKLHKQLATAVAVAGCVIGIGLVRWTHLLWDDLFLFFAGQFAHPVVQTSLNTGIQFARKHVPAVMRRGSSIP